MIQFARGFGVGAYGGLSTTDLFGLPLAQFVVPTGIKRYGIYKGKYMKKILTMGVLATLTLFVAGQVSAHVTVQPKESVVGHSVSSVRVPNEKEVSTTQVRVVVPEGVLVQGVMPVANWQYKVTREEPKEAMEESEDHHADEGRITEVTWFGGAIKAGEFMEFPLSVQYKADVDKVSWKAYQTYADGEVVAWDGSDEKLPAATVAVLKEAKVDSIVKSMGTTSPVTTASQNSWMSVGALLLSVAALSVSMKKK
jgi:uncharacterized protein YcnI